MSLKPEVWLISGNILVPDLEGKKIFLPALERGQEFRPQLAGLRVLTEDALIGHFTKYERWFLYGRYKGEIWPYYG